LIERLPTADWAQKALNEPHVTAAVQALTSLARSDELQYRPAILNRMNLVLPNAELPSDRLAAFYVYWLCLQGDVDQALQDRVASALDHQYPSSRYQENRWLSELLCQLKSPDVVAKTMNLLRAATDQTEQMQYLYVLRNTRHGWTPDDRRDYFQSLAQSEHYLGGQGMNDFLNRIREEAKATLTDEERATLGSLLEPSQAPAETVGPARALVQEWRVDDFSQLGGGDPVNGAQAFASASCSKCHRYGARGTMLGPDLTSARQRFSRQDLLVSILEPSKVIPESYRSLQIVTTDGQTYVGQASLSGDYRSSILRLATDPLAPTKFVEIEKKKIEVQKFAEVSWMPKGLLDTFTKQEILDLLAYLHGSP
jgi:putative heme-binding domain-containing protein